MIYTKRKKKFGVVRKKSKDDYNAYIDSLPPAEKEKKKHKKRKRRGRRKSDC